MIHAYCRYSQLGQSEGSTIRQEAIIEDWCAKNNCTVDKWWIDAGVSGFSKNNSNSDEGSQFSEMVHRLKKGDVILIERQSRFSRQKYRKVNKLFDKLLDAGIDIVTCSDNVRHSGDGSSLSDIGLDIKRMIDAHVAYKESEDKSEMAKASHKTRSDTVAEGKFAKVHAAGWLTLNNDGTAYELNENAKVVQKIFELSIAGMGMVSICRELNKEGIRTFQRDKEWATAGIAWILKNEAVIGTYAGIPNYFPAAITEDTFQSARGSIETRKTMRTTRTTKQINVWSGVLLCGKCGARIHISRINKKPDRWAICSGKKTLKKCTTRNIKQSSTEIVLKQILSLLGSQELVSNNSDAYLQELSVTNGKLATKQRKLDDIEKALQAEDGYNKILFNLAKITSEEVSELLTDKLRIEGLLHNERMLEGDRELFLSKIDLETPLARTKANRFLGRIGVTVEMKSYKNKTFGFEVWRNRINLMSVVIDAKNNTKIYEMARQQDIKSIDIPTQDEQEGELKAMEILSQALRDTKH